MDGVYSSLDTGVQTEILNVSLFIHFFSLTAACHNRFHIFTLYLITEYLIMININILKIYYYNKYFCLILNVFHLFGFIRGAFPLCLGLFHSTVSAL